MICFYPNQQQLEDCVVTRTVNLPDVILNMTRTVNLCKRPESEGTMLFSYAHSNENN